MRISKAFEIEKNYQKHLNKLKEISSSNLKRKVSLTTACNIKATNNYKKNKITAEIFSQREKNNNVFETNLNLQKNLLNILNREQKRTSATKFEQHKSLRRITSKSSLKSATSQTSRIREQNLKIHKRLNQTKSSYQKIKDNSELYKNAGIKKKEQVARLLEMGLGRKPRVIFPKVQEKKGRNKKSKYSFHK